MRDGGRVSFEVHAMDAVVPVVVEGLDTSQSTTLLDSWSGCVEVGDGGPRITTARVTARLRVDRSSTNPAASGHVPNVPSPDVEAATAELLAERLTIAVTGRLLEATRHEAVLFHAAGLADPSTGRTLALVGPSGRGKTTAAALLGRGLAYLTDETVAVTREARVLPYAKPLSIRRPGADGPKDQVSPSSLGLGVLGVGIVPHLHRIVLLDRRPGLEEAQVERSGLASVIDQLAPQISWFTHVDRGLHVLSRLVDACGGVHRVAYSEADQLPDVAAALLADETTPGRGRRWARGDHEDWVPDGSSVVVRSGTTLRVLDGVGAALWRALDRVRDERDLTRRVVQRLGWPGSGDPRLLVVRALDELAALGLVGVSVDTRR